jgi:hypothetical protein
MSAGLNPAGERYPGSAAQLRALFAFVFSTVSPRFARWFRWLLAGLGVLALAMIALAATAGPAAPDYQVLLPSAWLAVFVSTTLAAIGAAGGRELLPRAQASIYPITPATDYLGATALLPFNITWLLQSLALLCATAWCTGWSFGMIPSLLLTVLWIVSCTLVGQAVAWTIELIRSTALGSRLVLATGVLLVAAVAWAVHEQGLVRLFDAAPTRRYALVAALGSDARLELWPRAVAEPLVAGALALLVGLQLARLRARIRPRNRGVGEARPVRPRPDPAGVFTAVLRLDRASVWRSAPLRRGVLILVLVPGVAAALAALDWTMVTLLPGLVASGAGLLFGVNAFCLDGPGALWRSTLPAPPRLLLLVRGVVTAETCLTAAVLVVAIAVVRAPAGPSAGELTGVLVAMVAGPIHVTSHCLRWSVRNPHAATLRSERDQPAPPAAMAGYAARLAVGTTGMGLVLGVLGQIDIPAASVTFGLMIILLAARRVLRTLRLWEDPDVRGRVLATVSTA